MRLSEVLSKLPIKEYKQVESFLQSKKGNAGQNVNISVGKVRLNYFFFFFDDLSTFYSTDKLSVIFIDKKLISIDCVLTCGCGASIPVWFLVESKMEAIKKLQWNMSRGEKNE